jgi:hypothetical protein
MKKSTYSRYSEIVSTVKKSTASVLCACARRKVRQEKPERSPAGHSPSLAEDLPQRCRRHPLTEAVELADDPLESQRGFSRASRSTSYRISPPIGGWPVRPE